MERWTLCQKGNPLESEQEPVILLLHELKYVSENKKQKIPWDCKI